MVDGCLTMAIHFHHIYQIFFGGTSISTSLVRTDGYQGELTHSQMSRVHPLLFRYAGWWIGISMMDYEKTFRFFAEYIYIYMILYIYIFKVY